MHGRIGLVGALAVALLVGCGDSGDGRTDSGGMDAGSTPTGPVVFRSCDPVMVDAGPPPDLGAPPMCFGTPSMDCATRPVATCTMGLGCVVTQAEAKVRALGQALLDSGLSRDRPLAILSAGSIAHALMALAASHVGIPYCPVSPAYSLVATGFEKLAHVIDVVSPGMVFVENYNDFAPALARISQNGHSVVANFAAPMDVLSLAELAETTPTSRVDDAHRAIAPDDTRSILFTSGTTGRPKGVITTHRMTTVNQQMFLQTFPEFGQTPPVILSWLPWHHTSGANSILGSVLYNLGTLWIDSGKPIDGPPMQETIRNLQDVAPTAYFTAPSGFRLLAKALRDDDGLRRLMAARTRESAGNSLPS